MCMHCWWCTRVASQLLSVVTLLRPWRSPLDRASLLQVSAIAEFRANGNYAAALKAYQAAYQELSRIPEPPHTALQHQAELAAVAEQIHLKVQPSAQPEAGQRPCLDPP